MYSESNIAENLTWSGFPDVVSFDELLNQELQQE